MMDEMQTVSIPIFMNEKPIWEISLMKIHVKNTRV